MLPIHALSALQTVKGSCASGPCLCTQEPTGAHLPCQPSTLVGVGAHHQSCCAAHFPRFANRQNGLCKRQHRYARPWAHRIICFRAQKFSQSEPSWRMFRRRSFLWNMDAASVAWSGTCVDRPLKPCKKVIRLLRDAVLKCSYIGRLCVSPVCQSH